MRLDSILDLRVICHTDCHREQRLPCYVMKSCDMDASLPS